MSLEEWNQLIEDETLRYGTTFFAHVKYMLGGEPAGNSISPVYDPTPFTTANPVPISHVVQCSPTPKL